MAPFSYDIDYNPDPEGMIDNVDHGGLDFPGCNMEMDDNSEDKMATEINTFMLSDGKGSKKLSQLIHMDNGLGMTPEKLAHSIILAKRDSHGTGDIGKFGMGLNNATMALGNTITIIAKTVDGTSRGLYMDLAQMRRDKTFKPTLICEGAETFRALIARNTIFDAFMAQPSGVLISVKNIKMNIDDIQVEAKKLQNALGLAYKTRNSRTRIYTAEDSEPIIVDEVDVFYRLNPKCLDYRAETTLRVFMAEDKKTVIGVYEVLNMPRIKGKKNTAESSYYTPRPSKPLYIKLGLVPGKTNKGKIKYEHSHTQVLELPSVLANAPFYDITLNFTLINNDSYIAENEDSKFDGVPHRRRGLWFYRNSRCVGMCREQGSSLDDYSNRMRMEITFPPELDYHMGLRTQKQMGTITSSAISDAITVLWEQQNKELIRMHKRELKEQKQAEEETEYNEEEQQEILANSFPDEAPSQPIKAKKPVVAPTAFVATPVAEEGPLTSLLHLGSSVTLGLDEIPAPTTVMANAAEVEAPAEQVEEEHAEERVEEEHMEEECVEAAASPPDTPPVSAVDPTESSKSRVAGHDRITSKAEKDVVQICQSLQSLLEAKLPHLAGNPGITTSTEFTELWKCANRLITYFTE